MTTKITTTVLGDGAVTTPKLDDGAVTAPKLAVDAVNTINLINGSVTGIKIATLAVGTNHLSNNAVTGVKIADNTIPAGKLAVNSVGTGNIIDLSITTEKYALGSITSEKLGLGAVLTDNIGDLAVTAAKIANLTVGTNQLANLGVTTGKLANLAVTTPKLGNLAVTNDKIADGTIALNKLATQPIIQGLHSVWIPARALHPGNFNGAGFKQVIGGSATSPTIPLLTFSPSVQQYAEFSIFWPKSWNVSNLSVQFVWSHETAASNFGVVWGIRSEYAANNSKYNDNFSSPVSVNDTGGVAYNLYVSNEVSLPATGATADSIGYYQVLRAAGNGSDTLAVPALLHGLIIKYTVNAGDDS